MYDESPKPIHEYLSGISRDLLLERALAFCSLSTILDPSIENLFFAFLVLDDLEEDDIKYLKNRIKSIVNKNKER